MLLKLWQLKGCRACNHVYSVNPGIILSMRPAKGRRRYNVTSSLIGWTHTQNDPWWKSMILLKKYINTFFYTARASTCVIYEPTVRTKVDTFLISINLMIISITITLSNVFDNVCNKLVRRHHSKRSTRYPKISWHFESKHMISIIFSGFPISYELIWCVWDSPHYAKMHRCSGDTRQISHYIKIIR